MTEQTTDAVRGGLPIGGFGIVGLGVAGEPSKTRTRPDLCPEMGHPGTTYNTAMDMTWCLCGAEITDGDTAVPHIACCGGPLITATEEVFDARP